MSKPEWKKKFALLPTKMGVNLNDPVVWFKSYRERRTGSVTERLFNNHKYKIISS